MAGLSLRAPVMSTLPEYFVAPEDAFSNLHGLSAYLHSPFELLRSQDIQHGRVHLIDNCLGQMILHE
jgi:hypothetical protein